MTELPIRPHLLQGRPDLPESLRARIAEDHHRFLHEGLPADLNGYLRQTYGLDLTGSYAGQTLRSPWGKASGQLSMTLGQVEEAAEAGLGFVVLKTVIAEDQQGQRSMSAWAVDERRMIAEPIVGRESGIVGWTITWKGRGWWQSFEDYLTLVRESTALGRRHGMLIVPSVKYHLPAPEELTWRTDEYTYTTRQILDAFEHGGGSFPMPLEKDFSPTLAGSDLARNQETILQWLAAVPSLIREPAAPRGVILGFKLFNAQGGDDFQREILRAVHGPSGPDYLIYANRLFDSDREFAGQRGVAYGGPDLSDRNLQMLTSLRNGQVEGSIPRWPMEISATGDISSGKLAIEYALRGCTSFQVHTMFQLPTDAYPSKHGSKIERALHWLHFDPEHGAIAWMLHASNRLKIAPNLLDLAALGVRSRPDDLHAQLA
ncbi:MAG: hypothetical protein ABI353_12080 [Isosphaeraceae bacterium]